MFQRRVTTTRFVSGDAAAMSSPARSESLTNSERRDLNVGVSEGMLMKLTAFAAGVEAVTGLVLIIDPSLLARLLLGSDLPGSGQVVGRIAGFALVALGLACWPTPGPERRESAAVRALLAYNVLAAIFFLSLGFRGEFVGLLLWPAAALHAVLGILFVRVFVVDTAIK
jgi:hypothetical protein